MTYQVKKVDIGNSPHPLILCQSDQYQGVSNDGQHKYNDVQRYDKVTLKYTPTTSAASTRITSIPYNTNTVTCKCKRGL